MVSRCWRVSLRRLPGWRNTRGLICLAFTLRLMSHSIQPSGFQAHAQREEVIENLGRIGVGLSLVAAAQIVSFDHRPKLLLGQLVQAQRAKLPAVCVVYGDYEHCSALQRYRRPAVFLTCL